MSESKEEDAGTAAVDAELAAVLSEGTLDQVAAAIAATDRGEFREALRSFLGDVLATRSGLERHLLPFDTDGDEHLSWRETRAGFRAVGLGSATALFVATATHIVMGIPSADRPLSWSISLDRTERARHAADTGAYASEMDREATRVRVDALVRDYDADGDGRLDQADLHRLVAGNIAAERERGRPSVRRVIGGIASRMEFDVLLRLAGTEDPDGVRRLDAAALHDLYDGVLMYSMLPDAELAAAIVRARASREPAE